MDFVRSYKTSNEWTLVREYSKEALKSWAKGLVTHNYFPCVDMLRKYRHNFREFLIGDIIGAFSVVAMLLPMAMAYGELAGVGVKYGLYSSFLCLYAYAIFGTSRCGTVGPAGIISLLVLSELTEDDLTVVPELSFALSCWVGIVSLWIFFLDWGFLLNYISKPVLDGFVSGAAFTIGAAQVKDLFGIPKVRGKFVYLFVDFLPRLDETGWDLLLGVICMIALYLMSKFCTLEKYKHTKWRYIGFSRNLIQVLIATILCAFVPAIGDHVVLVKDIEELPAGLPQGSVPQLTGWTSFGDGRLIGSAIVIALVANLQHFAIVKPFSTSKDIECDISPNQEFFAIGMANIANSFVQGFPVCACFTRTAVNIQSGVRTQFSGIIAGTIMVIALQWATPAFEYIPMTSLAAIIMLAVWGMIKYKAVYGYYKLHDYGSLLTALVAFFVQVFVGSLECIISGVAVAMLISLWRMKKTRTSTAFHDGALILQFSGQITFLSLSDLTLKFEELAMMYGGERKGRTAVSRIVINCKQVYWMDVDAMKRLGLLLNEFVKLPNVSEDCEITILCTNDVMRENIHACPQLQNVKVEAEGIDGDSIELSVGSLPPSFDDLKKPMSNGHHANGVFHDDDDDDEVLADVGLGAPAMPTTPRKLTEP